MKAAVVTSFDAAPRYEEFPAPAPAGDDEMVVDVIAAGLHPRVRSQADGSHYTSTGELPLVPGIDGVGRGADGRLRYFVLPDTRLGAMAEQTVIDTRRSIVLPEDADPIAVAAAMNPAMSSWVALRQWVPFQAGQNVLVLGATGNAGQMAIQVARRLGANQVIAAGRNAGRLAGLPALGATGTVLLDTGPLTTGPLTTGLLTTGPLTTGPLDTGPPDGDAAGIAQRLGQAAAHADVVIDYLWGEPTAAAMAAVVTGRADRGQPLTWIEIGSVAGPSAAIPSAALRAARLQIVGSGQGSVSIREILTELPALAQEITAGSFVIDARPTSLTEVEQAWADAAATAQRIVITPQS
jgi:NADPH:quinone reductase-like Zn-dependent oxidoreductase